MRANGFVTALAAAMAVLAATVTGMPAARAGGCCATCGHGTCCTPGPRPNCKCNHGWPICWNGRSGQATSVEAYASEERLAALEEHILRAYDLGLVPVGNAASMMAEGIVLGDARLYDDGMETYLHALDSLGEEERAQL